LRDEKAVINLMRQIDKKVSGECPNDPYYRACNVDAILNVLEWVVGLVDEFEIETYSTVYIVDENGEVHAEDD